MHPPVQRTACDPRQHPCEQPTHADGHTGTRTATATLVTFHAFGAAQPTRVCTNCLTARIRELVAADSPFRVEYDDVPRAGCEVAVA